MAMKRWGTSPPPNFSKKKKRNWPLHFIFDPFFIVVLAKLQWRVKFLGVHASISLKYIFLTTLLPQNHFSCVNELFVLVLTLEYLT
jgi:hypothetical protein